MKKLLYFVVLLLVVSCNNKKAEPVEGADVEQQENDSTLYGVCGEGSAMHTLQLITNMQDTLMIHIDDEDADNMTSVVGGLHVGDRMAVTAQKDDNVYVAQRIINITSLIGHWRSIDRDFDISEDGEVKSNVEEETNAWTAWRILNGQLLLNADTFDIVTLSADSLDLEGSEGIYAFQRIHSDVEPAENDSTAVE